MQLQVDVRRAVVAQRAGRADGSDDLASRHRFASPEGRVNATWHNATLWLLSRMAMPTQPLPVAHTTRPSTGETTVAPLVPPPASTRSSAYWLRPWWVPPL